MRLNKYKCKVATIRDISRNAVIGEMRYETLISYDIKS